MQSFQSSATKLGVEEINQHHDSFLENLSDGFFSDTEVTQKSAIGKPLEAPAEEFDFDLDGISDYESGFAANAQQPSPTLDDQSIFTRVKICKISDSSYMQEGRKFRHAEKVQRPATILSLPFRSWNACPLSMGPFRYCPCR